VKNRKQPAGKRGGHKRARRPGMKGWKKGSKKEKKKPTGERKEGVSQSENEEGRESQCLREVAKARRTWYKKRKAYFVKKEGVRVRMSEYATVEKKKKRRRQGKNQKQRCTARKGEGKKEAWSRKLTPGENAKKKRKDGDMRSRDRAEKSKGEKKWGRRQKPPVSARNKHPNGGPEKTQNNTGETAQSDEKRQKLNR